MAFFHPTGQLQTPQLHVPPFLQVGLQVVEQLHKGPTQPGLQLQYPVVQLYLFGGSWAFTHVPVTILLPIK